MRFAFLCSLLLLLSCRSIPDSALKGDSLETDCASTDALAAPSFNGEKVYAVTQSCVFNQKVHDVRMRVLSETYSKVLSDGCQGLDSGYGHAIEVVIDGHHVDNVGFKVRGNTSRCNEKRQFKFSFTQTDLFSQDRGQVEALTFPENKNRKFFGLEQLSLRASANDPAMIRENVSSGGYARENYAKPATLRGPASYRLAFARFFVSFNRTGKEGPEGTFSRLLDGYYYDYKGLYSLAENVDKVFLQTRFQAGNSSYKDFHLVEADLALASLEPETYDPRGWSPEFFDGGKIKKPEQQQKLEAALFELMAVLKPESSDADLEQLINVDSVVNYTATSFLNGHWDSLLANANNDFLYFDGATRQWQIIAWDLDNTLGTNAAAYKSLMGDDVFQPGKVHPNRLLTILFAPERTVYRRKLVDQIRQLLGGYYAPSAFEGRVRGLEADVRDHAESWEKFTPSAYDDILRFMDEKRSGFAAGHYP